VSPRSIPIRITPVGYQGAGPKNCQIAPHALANRPISLWFLERTSAKLALRRTSRALPSNDRFRPERALGGAASWGGDELVHAQGGGLSRPPAAKSSESPSLGANTKAARNTVRDDRLALPSKWCLIADLRLMGFVTTLVTAPSDHGTAARQELVTLLEEALTRADKIGESLVAAHINQALETVRQRF